MFQFFVEPEQIQGDQVIISGSDVNHIRNVLRMRGGEQVRINDNAGRDLYCEIQEMKEGQIFLSILGQAQGTEPELKVTFKDCLRETRWNL